MSAEPPRRNTRTYAQSVRPQSYSDKTVVESVVDFFQDVAYSHSPPKYDEQEKVTWLHFEETDLNDLNSNPDLAGLESTRPLVLSIGYTNGAQIWSLQPTGEAFELLSLCQGPVRFLRLVPNPELGDPDVADSFASKRPLIALCDYSCGDPCCYNVKILSLRTGEECAQLPFPKEIVDIKCNTRVLVVALHETIVVYNNSTMTKRFCVTGTYFSPGLCANPTALGPRFLAYADQKLVPVHQSYGGISADTSQSYTASVISAAKSLGKGLSYFSQSFVDNYWSSKPAAKETSQGASGEPGIVTIIDVLGVKDSQFCLSDTCESDGLVAHFPAHLTNPIVAMSFDPSGSLLVTVDKSGHSFSLFRVYPQTVSSSLAAVVQLYTLYRGDTTAKVQDLSFTPDSRWLAVTTLRGTTHLFPITPYGGPTNSRTHTSPAVVNRASRFHRSAGLEDVPPRSGHGSLSTSPSNAAAVSSSPGKTSPKVPRKVIQKSVGMDLSDYQVMTNNAINNSMNNPRYPPFSHPITQSAMGHIRQNPLSIPGIGSGGSSYSSSSPSSSLRGKSQNAGGSSTPDGVTLVAAAFGKSRGWIAGSPIGSREKGDPPRPIPSLFIMNNNGLLVEHLLDPLVKHVPGEKHTEQSQFELQVIPRAQWTLRRGKTGPEMPLRPENLLLVASDCVQSGKPSEAALQRNESRESLSSETSVELDEEWLSQVEMQTHQNPHRRLWMGPQFTFKTFQQGSSSVTGRTGSVVSATTSGSNLSQSPLSDVTSTSPPPGLRSPPPGMRSPPPDVYAEEVQLESLSLAPNRSDPVATPGGWDYGLLRRLSGSNFNLTVIETDDSYEQSPKLDSYMMRHMSDRNDKSIEAYLYDAMHDVAVDRPRHRSPCGKKRSVSGGISDVEAGSSENLSESSGSVSSGFMHSRLFDAPVATSPHSNDTVIMFPGQDSPEFSQ